MAYFARVTTVMYAFIERHRRAAPVAVQCRVLEVSVSGYHAHCVRHASDAKRRYLSDEALLVNIKAAHDKRMILALLHQR